MKTGAVVVAAGISSEQEGFRPIMKMGSISIICRIIANFQQAGIFPIVVVTGFRAVELERHISKFGVICVRNVHFEDSEMIDSAKLGLAFIQDKCERVLFSPVDIPLFTLTTIEQLLASNAEVTKPVYDGNDGHPILLACDLIPKILTVQNRKGGLEQAMLDCSNDIVSVIVEDEGILKEANMMEDNDVMLRYHNQQMLRPDVEVSLMREGVLLDKNGAMLLFAIEYEGTVKDACYRLGFSYSKAWQMISTFEKNVGYPIVERQAGGECGGKSALTEEGRTLLIKYQKFVEEVKWYANGVFPVFFEDVGEKG